MLQLPNGCYCSKPTIHPKNWKLPGASLKVSPYRRFGSKYNFNGIFFFVLAVAINIRMDVVVGYFYFLVHRVQK